MFVVCCCSLFIVGCVSLCAALRLRCSVFVVCWLPCVVSVDCCVVFGVYRRSLLVLVVRCLVIVVRRWCLLFDVCCFLWLFAKCCPLCVVCWGGLLFDASWLLFVVRLLLLMCLLVG